MNNLALAEHLDAAARLVRKDFYDRPAPRFLCHYTRQLEAARNILRTSCLWATAISEQKDATEIKYGFDLFGEVLKEATEQSATDSFERGILSCLPTAVAEARTRVFITCFCTSDDSDFHWKNYGDFCFCAPFTLPTGMKFVTRFRNASVWLHPIIYSREEQLQIARALVADVLAGVRRHCWGIPSGGKFEQFFFQGASRALSDVFVSFLSSFKAPAYTPEREWRLVVCPKLSAFHSAPSMLTESFDREIEKEPIRHVRLMLRQLVLNGSVLEDRLVSPWLRVIQRDGRETDDRPELRKLVQELGLRLPIL